MCAITSIHTIIIVYTRAHTRHGADEISFHRRRRRAAIVNALRRQTLFSRVKSPHAAHILYNITRTRRAWPNINDDARHHRTAAADGHTRARSHTHTRAHTDRKRFC